MIKWLVTFDAATENIRLDYEDVNFFANCMYPGVTETSFVNAFLKKCDLEIWMMQCERPKLLEYFLHHLRQSGKNLKYNEASECAPIDACVMLLHFLNIAPLLK
ncbi:hypothetical protein AVEN_51641-1 [Araneus ventricosus]|uniref:Uncharacterized protein n=1 Tax=Araneus ventricosus TaxID=182803 RepID=A0A4Y2MWJ3_ARAVE|nr:hypothetical protein AVEN_51641-1 [Araneus ventricosus]